MINSVTLIGRLGKDPEIRRTNSGTAVTNFSVATSEKYKDGNGEWQEKTEWHNIVCWDKLAEWTNDYKKGQLVYIEGKLQTDKYDKDGQTHYATKVIAQKVRLLEKRDQPQEAEPYNSNNDFPGF